MSFIKSDAPRTLLSFIWATAVMLTIFFAVILSSFFVLKHYYPVSASEVMVLPKTADCDATKNQSQIAINNYPGEAAITAEYAKTNAAYQHGPVEDALGGYYQCSVICVPGIDQKKPVSDPANISVIKSYLIGATIGGKPILADVPNGTSFVGTVKLAIAQANPELKQEQLEQLKRIVIIPYSKATICAGNPGGKGQSVPYEKIVTKDKQEVKEIVPNDTKAKADLAQAQQKAASEKADAVAPEPIAGPPEKNKVSAPVVTAKGGTEPSANTETLAQCKANINEFLYKYSLLLAQIKPEYVKDPDPDVTRYYEISADNDALKKDPYLSDETKASSRCQEIEKLVTAMSTKLWSDKTVLAQCKKTVNDFLYTYKNKQVTVGGDDPIDKAETAAAYYKQASDDNWHIKNNPYYWVSAERQTKMCNDALQNIEEYKVLLGGNPGPVPLTTGQVSQAATEQEQQLEKQRWEALAESDIKFYVSGQAVWDLNTASNKTNVCVSTYKRGDGSPGTMGHVFSNNGSFNLGISFKSSEVQGVAVLIYDSGGTKASRDVLRKWDLNSISSWIYQSFVHIDNINYTMIYPFGTINLADGVGVSKTKYAQFKALTGHDCP